MSSLPMVEDDDESALYIDETSIAEDMQIGEDDDILSEDMDFEEEEEIGGFPAEDFSRIDNDSSLMDKVFIMKVPESKLPAGTSIKKISSASDATHSNSSSTMNQQSVQIQQQQIIKLPNPNMVSIKDISKVK